VIGNAHEGLKPAAGKVPGAGWQRCRVHVMRNLPGRAPNAHAPGVSTVVEIVFAEKDSDRAHAHRREVADRPARAVPRLGRTDR